MKEKKNLYIAAAVSSALSLVEVTQASAVGYDPQTGRCYGAALAGQNDCKGDKARNDCASLASRNCDPNEYKNVKSAAECEQLLQKNCPQNLKKR